MRSRTGVKQFLREAEKMRGFEDRARRNLDAVMPVVLEDMRAEVHIDTGALKGSGSWSSHTDASGDYVGTIEFGGFTAPYALYELNRKGHGIDDVWARHESTFDQAIRDALDT